MSIDTIAPPSLASVRDALLALPRFTCESVQGIVEDLRLTRDEIRPYVRFSDEGYQRTRVHGCERFEMLVLCWKAGQASPVHDHARSICTMAVIEGECTAQNYRMADDRPERAFAPDEAIELVRTEPLSYAEGSVNTVIGGDIHRIGNEQTHGRDLITLHVYLPPIRSMRCFDPDDGRWWTCEPTAHDPRP